MIFLLAKESVADVLELGHKRTGLFHKRFNAQDQFVKNFRVERMVFSATNTKLVADKVGFMVNLPIIGLILMTK